MAETLGPGDTSTMSAQREVPDSAPAENELLGADTSAALLVWMDTAQVPDGIRAADWERWVDGDCQGPLTDATGAPVTPAMLGRWARSCVVR